MGKGLGHDDALPCPLSIVVCPLLSSSTLNCTLEDGPRWATVSCHITTPCSFLFFAVVSSSSRCFVCLVMVARTASFVIYSLYEMPSTLLRQLISTALIFLCRLHWYQATSTLIHTGHKKQQKFLAPVDSYLGEDVGNQDGYPNGLEHRNSLAGFSDCIYLLIAVTSGHYLAVQVNK